MYGRPDDVVNAAFDKPSSLASQVDTFVDMLTYTARPVSHWSLPAQKYQHAKLGSTIKYDPPMEEFTVPGTFPSAKDAKEEHLSAVDGPTMGIVTRGKVKISTKKGSETQQLTLDEGAVVFIAAKNEVDMEVIEGRGPDEAGEVWWSVFGA